MNYVTHRSFELHDGEDETKTDDLHAFLEQPVNSRGHEWEGHNAGIYVMLHVNVGDTIVVIGDGAILVLRKGEKVKIMAHTFPFVWAGMREIELDNGAHHVNRISGEEVIDLTTFTMPYDYGVHRLVAAENALYNFVLRFGAEMMTEFVAGDQAKAEENIRLNPELGIASALLNSWFNGWREG
jgi:hypothetical protein